MKNALFVLNVVCQNAHVWLKQDQTVKNQACSFSRYRVCLSEGISQSASH